MTLQGCYSDNTGSRTLGYLAYDDSSNTIELCTTTCYNAGYSIAGVEYGSQCYCADELFGGASYLVESACGETCAGNANETCGDFGRINIYSDGTPVSYAAPGNPESVDNGNYFYQDCYSDSVSSRTLSAKSYTDTKNMTLENCAAFCSGYEYFGIEYAEECYCGSCFNGGSTILAQSKCEMTCTGNPSEYCGAGNALSVYQLSS
ncbi:WSC domain-containing protein, partial [Delphinella strobiligena]